MLSIIGAIIGILGSILPEWLKNKKAKQDNEHELKMFELQLKAAEQQHQYKVEELNVQADIQESEALYRASEIKLTGSTMIDGVIALYNSSVRPTVTYAFLLLYAYVKYSMIYAALQQGSVWQVVGAQIWSSEDFAIFSTIMGYWFGSRGMKHALERIPKIQALHQKF